MPTKPAKGAATAPRSSTVYGLALVALLLMGSAWNFSRYFNAPDEVREQTLKRTHAAENVFRIYAGRGGGTGYLIQDWRFGIVVLTNRHICDINPSEGIFVLDQDGVQYLSKVRRIAKLTDLCLLEPPQELLAKFGGLSLAPDAYRPSKYEWLFVYGHPGLRKLTSSSGPFVNESWIPRITEDHIDADTMRVGRSDIVIYPGSPGSPVLNRDGQVVGTIFAYEGVNHIALYVPLREMIEFLSGGM
jgi:S1-C subfamily serine protease